MANFIRTTDSETQGRLNGNQSGLITENGGIWISGLPAVHAASGDNSLTVEGYLYTYTSANGPTPYAAVDADGDTLTLLVGPSGFITAETAPDGVVDADLSGSLDLVNFGVIRGANGAAVAFDHTDGNAAFLLENHGTLSTNFGAAVQAQTGGGVIRFVNFGEVVGVSQGASLVASAQSGPLHYMTNHGTVTTAQGTALLLNQGNAPLFATNTGVISGVTAGMQSEGDGAVELINTGTISASASFGTALSLGAGDDIVVQSGLISGGVTLAGGHDHFDGRLGQTTGRVDGGQGRDRLEGGFGPDHLAGNNRDDTLFGHGGADSLEGGSANDWISGGDGEDTLEGGDGADTLQGGTGDDALIGGDEADWMFGEDGHDQLLAGPGADRAQGGAGDDQADGGAGNDRLEGGSGKDSLDGGTGNDTLEGGHDNDTLFGNSDFDTLYGNGGDDLLDGGGRNDRLIGGKGDDTLIGGGGNDTFVIRRVGNGDDTVVDFQNGADRVDLLALGIQNFNALNNTFGALSETADGVLIDLEAAGGSGSILLEGMTLADMDGTDFIF